MFMVNWFINRAPKAILEEYGWTEQSDKKEKKKKEKLLHRNRKEQ